MNFQLLFINKSELHSFINLLPGFLMFSHSLHNIPDPSNVLDRTSSHDQHSAQLADTHAEQAPLAPGVAEHLLHGAVLQRVGVLAGELVSVGGMQRAAALGLQQHVREQEEHLGLSVRTFRRNHLQPTLADVPPPWERREEQKKQTQSLSSAARLGCRGS